MSDRPCDNQKVLEQLNELFNEKLSASEAKAVSAFAEQYFFASTQGELSERKLENLYDATLSCWQSLQSFSGEKAQIRVFNPDLEQHGWRAQHTVVEILQRDMPFLVDTARMAMNRHGRAIHTVHNAVLRVQREGDRFVAMAGPDDEHHRESAIYMEIDRTSDADELKALTDDLAEVLTYADASVQDYQQMIAKARELQAELAERGDAEATEASAFMEWMLDDRFTFLGYDEVAIDYSGDEALIRRVEGVELGTMKLVIASGRGQELDKLSAEERSLLLEPVALAFGKDNLRAMVHRPAYRDRVVVKRFDDQGNVIGKCRFYGLYTSRVYTENPSLIPVLRQKVESVQQTAGFDASGHNAKALVQIMSDLPRDELFLSSEAELLETAMGIFGLQERRRARLLVRRDRLNQFVTCLFFVPRDIFNTALRIQVQDLLETAFGAEDGEFTTTFSESILARVQFVLRVDPANPVYPDLDELEARVVEVSRSWSDELHDALTEICGEEQGHSLQNAYRNAFTSAYREHFSATSAVYDIQRIEALNPGNRLTMSFYRVLEQSPELLRFKLFNEGEPLVLSDVIPVLENLGMRVVGEHPYEVRRADGRSFWMHDFTLIYQGEEPVVLEDVKDTFQDAFASIWTDHAENDEFNRLVIGANLSWREVAMLRAYARYNRQLRFGFSQPYIAETLARHVQVTKLLVALFRARFQPERQGGDKVLAVINRIESSIIDALEKVDNLNDDQILRRLLELMKATLRTNYFQKGPDGKLKDYFSFKLNPRAIAGIPAPRPMFEVFVYSARVEGVHLRGGKVARGGLRWSDRLEDYRTEVLGLVKAQQVKNAVIVPVGAKGGFVAKQLPTSGGREAFQAEGIASYQIFISALLDITDNLVAGEVVPPVDVVRHDEDDPYFVVAADKGTATFSDIANAIAEERGFWLGDAFASGGSQGYDHKGMGITARGAWESVKLHFRELGLDTQTEEFTVVAIGDMAGDVFGNGMLLSETIRMCAAFNHLHIFIDPNPDAASSFVERKRMFELPRSSWEDYNQELISEGGGVFSRASKWIDITPQMKARFDITEDRLSPNDLITALLKSPVDLIWNGGIGTYVKASSESHADVGDKANDSLRINGNQLRCKVLGEGGNLGFTQQGRIEFGRLGGKSNTDFIDNAGGVDCSDHEVNIKILLNEVVANGDMTVKQRNSLLREMTDEVSELVLQNNYEQAQALSIALTHCRRSMDEYIRLINRLEADGKLDRELEFLPSNDELQERKANGEGLSRPELSVLISYVKAELKEQLIDSWINRDTHLSSEIMTAFPQRLVAEFSPQIEAHRLRREIIATQVANHVVNTMGITFVERLAQSSGANLADCAAAFVVARDVFGIEALWQQIEALDNQVPSSLQQKMMSDLTRMLRRAAYWLLRNRRPAVDVAGTVALFRPGVEQIASQMEELIKGEPLEAWRKNHNELVEAGVPDELAGVVAGADSLYSLLGIIQAAEDTNQPLERVAQIYFGLGEHLELHWFDQQVKEIEVTNHWQSMARDGFREDLNNHQQAITASVLRSSDDVEDGSALVNRWLNENGVLLARWQRLLAEIRSASVQDFAIFTVAIRELLELAQADS